MNKVLILIPAYNEEQNLPAIFDQLCTSETQEFADILVVNDASTDQTASVARAYPVTLINNVFNLGYGSALQVGYKYAVQYGYEYIIQMDSDGQHDISNIPLIYKNLVTPDSEGAYPDIVIGSRFMEGSVSFKISTIKRWSILFFRWIIKKATGKWITDPTSGLQGLSKRAFLYYSQYRNFDYFYPDANMIIQMLLLGFRITEVPAIMHERTAGISMHKGLFKQITYMIIMPLSILGVTLRIKKRRT